MGFAGLFSGSLLDSHRRAKQERYHQHIRQGYEGPRCVAEGDSWFELPSPFYATDLIRELGNKYAIFSLARASDGWKEVTEQDEIRDTVKSLMPDIVLLSISGNDILGRVHEFVHPWKHNRQADKYLKPNFGIELRNILFLYEELLSSMVKAKCNVIVHGYAYGDPRWPDRGGYLIGAPLSQKRNINDETIWRSIVKSMVDQFNDGLEATAAKAKFRGMVEYINLTKELGVGEEWWADEVHPNKKGFKKISKIYAEKIDSIWEKRRLIS